MDFLQTDTKKLYFKFLLPSMTSALVTSIYFFVDAIAVGQSEGALGTAAMAVTSPTYGVIAFLAVLCGVGGSVMMSMAKGNGEEEKGNACFTTAVVLMSILTVILWIVFFLFREEIFTLFGANAEVMPKTVEYGKWIIWFLPVFIFTPFMGAFIRNDGAPGIFRLFFPMFLFLGVTILADYYLQSVMEVKMSIAIGLSHSILISGLMIVALPAIWRMDGVWLAMPVTELTVGLICAGYIIRRVNRKLA